MGDIFALQDELTQRIIAVLSIKMGEEEHKRLAAKGTRNLGAYDLFLRGLEYFNQYTKEANVQARMMFKKALDLDPGYAMACEKMGWTHFIDWTMGWSNDPESLNQAFDLGQQAATDPTVYSAMSICGEKSTTRLSRSMRNPSSSIPITPMAFVIWVVSCLSQESPKRP